jgi:hypothetical protein
MLNMKETDHFKYLGLGKKITLKWILKIKMEGQRPYSCCVGQDQVAGSCEHGNEHF